MKCLRFNTLHLVIIFACLLFPKSQFSQIGGAIPADRRVDWTISGTQEPIPAHIEYDEIVNITEPPYSVVADGVTDASGGIQAAINDAVDSELTMIFFPPGVYLIENPIVLETIEGGTGALNDNNVVLVGSGQYHTILKFNKSSTKNNILIKGDTSDIVIGVDAGYVEGSTDLVLDAVYPGLEAGDFIRLMQDPYTESEWDPADCNGGGYAANRLGQILEVENVFGTYITLAEEVSFNYSAAKNVRILKVSPIENSGVEDMTLLNVPGNAGGNKIQFLHAANCWVRGVESNMSTYPADHFVIKNSTHITVFGCYIHGGNNLKQNYGVSIGNSFTSNCLVENNVITYTRHAIVGTTSCMKNVVSYNFANNSRRATEGGAEYPTADILLHGYYPTATLFEGNVTPDLHSDVYHGKQGKYNTFFRNSTVGGVPDVLEIWAAGWPNIFGNDGVSGVSLSDGDCYSSWDELIMCNTPMISCTGYSDYSYYLTERPGFLSDQFYTWPPLGPSIPSGPTTSGSIPAEYRYNSGGQQCDYKRSYLVGYSVKNRGLLTAINENTYGDGLLVRNQDEYSIGRENIVHEVWSSQNVSHVTTARLASTGKEEIIYVINGTWGTKVFVTTDKQPIAPGTSPVFSQEDSRITAITAGDFTGDGYDEIVIGLLDEDNKPFIYRSTDENNLKQQTIYSNPSVYWTVSALTTGDFDNDEDYELITGFNSTGSASAIYHSEDALNVGVKIWEDLSGYWDVDALAAGDFNEDGKDELLEGYNSSAGPSIYKVINGLDDPQTLIYSRGSDLTLEAMAAGDFDFDGDDEAVYGFNSATQGPKIYKSELANTANVVWLYDKPTPYWEVYSLAVEKCPGYYDHNGDCIFNPTTTNQGGGNYNSISDPDSLNVEQGLEEFELAEDFIKIYPNPSDGLFTIELNNVSMEETDLVIYNQFGSIVQRDIIPENNIMIDLSKEPSGIYFVYVTSGDKTFMKRIVRI